jgi:hypothetical protein
LGVLIVLGVMSCCACTSDVPPTASAATAPDVDPGPPPAIPTTEGAVTRPCGFHDHVNEGDARFYGTVFVDPR